jgi:hypothetical protein
MKASSIVLAVMLSCSATVDPCGVEPWQPSSPPRWGQNAYFAYEPNIEFSNETGDGWYSLSALEIEGDKVSLRQFPRVCVGGRMLDSGSDAGVAIYKGKVFDEGGRSVASLKMTECRYCGPGEVGRTLKRSLSNFTSNTVTLGTMVYDKRIDPDTVICPPPIGDRTNG